MKCVSIIDYGVGNILSVGRAFESQGIRTKLISTPEEIWKAEKLVLPGVGAFANGMAELNSRDLVHSIQEYCAENRPFLGICLGMQLMLGESEEFGQTYGLGIVPGKVVGIEGLTITGERQKVPHVGWNGLYYKDMLENSILQNIAEGSKVYFVHSFHVVPDDERDELACTYYGGRKLIAVIKKGNCYGTQFHPEKSGKIGLKIIRNFVAI